MQSSSPTFEQIVNEIGSNLDDDAENFIVGLIKENPQLAKRADNNGFTLLHHAINNFRYSVARFLISIGADLNVLTNDGRSPLDLFPRGFGCSEEEALPCYKIFVAKGAVHTNGGVLIRMIFDGKEDLVIEKVKNEPELLNSKFAPVGSLLHCAASLAHGVELATYLLGQGIDVNLADEEGQTALHLVMHRPYRNHRASLDLIRLLIKNGANLNLRNKLGYTPLHEAARRSWEEPVKLLVGLGAPINAKTNEGETALDIVYSMRFLGGRSLGHWLKKQGACSGKPRRKRA